MASAIYLEEISISVFLSVISLLSNDYIHYISKSLNLEIVFWYFNIYNPFHFTLFVKIDRTFFTILVIFLYLCSDEKGCNNSIISSTHDF